METADDYLDEWRRGYVLPVVFIAFLYLLGGLCIYGSFVPDSMIVVDERLPYIHIMQKPLP